MAKVVVFGAKDFAQLAHFYLSHDSPHEVVAFAVDEAYLPADRTHLGLPVVAFESVEQRYPPADYVFFAPMSPSRVNADRARVYAEAKRKGYTLISYVSSRATVFGNPIGDNCFILEDNTIQPFTSIGNNVVMWSGNHIGHHGEIKDHVFFTSHVVLSGHCVVEPYAFFGVNATVRDGLTIAEGSFIAMGAVVTRNTDAWGVYKAQSAEKGPKSSKELGV